MQLEIGSVLEGKVTGVMKFGAFVALPEGKKGLVHISEIYNGFVSDIDKFVKVGDTVRVKVLSINGDKINLSMKQAEGKPEGAAQPKKEEPKQENGFEDKLKKFMQESDSRIAGNPIYADRGKNRRRR